MFALFMFQFKMSIVDYRSALMLAIYFVVAVDLHTVQGKVFGDNSPFDLGKHVKTHLGKMLYVSS